MRIKRLRVEQEGNTARKQCELPRCALELESEVQGTARSLNEPAQTSPHPAVITFREVKVYFYLRFFLKKYHTN